VTDAAGGGRGSVLVVDDDDDIRETVVELLRDEGYEAEGAANGREALDRLRAATREPDLILLDLLMPVMDGEQFREEQVKDPRLAAIRTVVISANFQVRETAARMGVTGYIRKPVDLDVLLDTVAAHAAH
jgi:CheY-like chemotaxis protein